MKRTIVFNFQKCPDDLKEFFDCEYIMYIAYKEDADKGCLTCSYEEKDMIRINELQALEIFEFEESQYEVHSKKSIDDLIKELELKGFVYMPEFKCS